MEIKMNTHTHLFLDFHRRYSIHKQPTTSVILLVNGDQMTSLHSNEELVSHGCSSIIYSVILLHTSNKTYLVQLRSGGKTSWAATDNCNSFVCPDLRRLKQRTDQRNRPFYTG